MYSSEFQIISFNNSNNSFQIDIPYQPMISLNDMINDVSSAAQGCVITTAKFLISSCNIALSTFMNHLKSNSEINQTIVNNLIDILHLITSFGDMCLELLGRTGNNLVDVSFIILIY